MFYETLASFFRPASVTGAADAMGCVACNPGDPGGTTASRQDLCRATGSAHDSARRDLAIEQARIDENQQLADVLRNAVGVAMQVGEPG